MYSKKKKKTKNKKQFVQILKRRSVGKPFWGEKGFKSLMLQDLYGFSIICAYVKKNDKPWFWAS